MEDTLSAMEISSTNSSCVRGRQCLLFAFIILAYSCSLSGKNFPPLRLCWFWVPFSVRESCFVSVEEVAAVNWVVGESKRLGLRFREPSVVLSGSTFSSVSVMGPGAELRLRC